MTKCSLWLALWLGGLSGQALPCSSSTVERPAMRRMHLVRPDLIPYPFPVVVYC